MIGPQHAREYYVRKKANEITDRIMRFPSGSVGDALTGIKVFTPDNTPADQDLTHTAYLWEQVATFALELSLEYQRQASEKHK